MEELPPMEGLVAALKKVKVKEEKEKRVFASSVDQEEAAACLCQACPPRDTQEETDYCCASLFALPLLKKGELLRDGLLAKLKEKGSHPCIVNDPLFRDYILTEPIALAAAETFSILSGEPITDVNKALRYGAYRLVIAKSIGHLGKGVRIRLPACVVHAIREIWPSANYSGFAFSEMYDM